MPNGTMLLKRKWTSKKWASLGHWTNRGARAPASCRVSRIKLALVSAWESARSIIQWHEASIAVAIWEMIPWEDVA